METTEQTSALTGAQNTATQASQSAHQPATDGATSGSSNGATLTQDEVNKLVGKARTEGKATAVNDLLKTLGVASSDDLKALIEDARKRAQADMTEAQKLQAERDRIAKEKDDLSAQLQAERDGRRNDKIASALISAASKLKANDTDDVLRYARDKHSDALSTLMDDNGAIDDKKVSALLDKIKGEKAHYFVPAITGAGSPSNSGGRILSGDAEAQKRALETNQRILRGR